MKRKTILMDLDNVCGESECNRTHYARDMCNKHYQRWYYREKGVPTRAQQRETIRHQRLLLKQDKIDLVLTAKDVPCLDCGQQFPSYVMDFDHVRGEKRFNISRAMHGTWSIETMRAEIAKCEVVCANCHRIRTHGGDSYDHDQA